MRVERRRMTIRNIREHRETIEKNEFPRRPQKKRPPRPSGDRHGTGSQTKPEKHSEAREQ